MTIGNAYSNDNTALFVEKPGYGKYDIHDLISLLKNEFEYTKEKIRINSKKSGSVNSLLNSERDELRKVSHLRRNASEKVNSLAKEIVSYENYIRKIEINRQKNRQLEKLNELSFDYNISLCPLCGSKLSEHDEFHCKLCNSDKTRISTPKENLVFLEDEKASFEKILNIKNLELKRAEESLSDLKEKESSLKKILDYQIQTYYGDDLNKLREQIVKSDSLIIEINKYESLLNQWNNLRNDLDNISKLEDKKEFLEQEIQKYKQSQDDQKILNTLVHFFQYDIKKMNLFKANQSLISRIKIDEYNNYEPYLDLYDLYNINSSSDNIRIFLSYYLSLLQTSLKLTEYSQIKYPSLLILDEPRQQNLDDKEIRSFVEIVNNFPSLEWQIILTTFNKHEKDYLSRHINYEFKNENDFLLKRIH